MTNTDLIIMGVKQKSYPQYLFKFRTCNHHTENIITNNELWFSNPLDFNDPFDCNIPISSSFSIDQIKDWLKDSCGITDISEINDLSSKLHANPDIVKNASIKAMQEMGVCCFSADEYSILQWSHYSNYHKGICLKFDITKNPELFDIPVIVYYRNIMPHYNHITQSKKIVEYLIQPKFHQWSYENEVRVVKTKSLMNANRDNRVFKYKDEALVEIIFGF